MRKFTFVLTLSVLIACSSGEDKPKGPVFESDGIALAGYDPVAYFEQSEAKMGDKKESFYHQGLTYQFASSKNKALFEADPEKYLPDYGGWCAYAVAEGSIKMEPDPTMWQIQDGKLQLFYDDWMTSLTGNLKEAWNEDAKSYKIKADKNWEQMEN